ncbi:MAG: tryptophan synthase subunit alpha [Crocinitomicaceae bacterium]|nr:tryptophan synthase subunit alpha [Crocinitomicaceae bacterium]
MNPFIKDSKQLSIFVTAGYPKLDSLKEQIPFLERSEVDFIEIGIPFSDPMADGPTIQESSSIALENGMNLGLLFEQLKQIEFKLPIVLMGYFNPILKYGVERFLKDCQSTGITSVIVPDMSLEIYEHFYIKSFKEFEVHPSFLITPLTEQKRVERIAEICKNSFVYLVSSNSTTGSNYKIPDHTESYQRIKTLCKDTPLFVGFGIKTKEDVIKIQESVDGAIIGSAYLSVLKNNREREYLESIL